VNVKKSKLQRKYVRAMDQLADVSRPARRFKYPPTFGNRRLYATYPVGRLRRYMRRAEEVTTRLLDARAELERQQTESKRALDAARRRERRSRMSPRAIAGRLFNRRSAK
jgi:hypothetical protein